MAIRLSGLTSGMDTDAIVQELVSAYSKKTEKYEKASTKLTWKQDSWKALNTKIYDLYTKVSNMRFSSAYNLRKTTVSDATKAMVTASSGAVTGTQTLSINKTAQSAYMTGAQLSMLISDKDEDKSAGETTLEDLGYKGNYTVIKYKCNGETKEIGVKKDTTISEFINELKEAGLNASLDENNRRIFVNAKTSGEKSDFSLVGDSMDALDALSALGLNEALVTKDKDGNTVFTDAAGSFKEYNEYYKEALNPLKMLDEPKTTLQKAPELLVQKPEELGEDATDDEIAEYEEALAEYNEAYDTYISQLAEWNAYNLNKDAYEQYVKDYSLATSTSYVDYQNKYVQNMVAAGYLDKRENSKYTTDAEYEAYIADIKNSLQDNYSDTKKAEATEDVLLYYMRDKYCDYNIAVRENINLQMQYDSLENTNKAWANKLSLLESQLSAKTSLKNIMTVIDEAEKSGTLTGDYGDDGEEISKLIKELRGIDIFETDKDGKKTGKISEAALNKAKEVCKTALVGADATDDTLSDELKAAIEAEAKDLLGILDNKSEDVENVEDYVRYHDDITEIVLDEKDTDGNVTTKGVESQIADIKAKIEANQATLTKYQEDIAKNKALIEANAEMADIDAFDEDGELNEDKLDAALGKLVDKAKKANEIITNPSKYDGSDGKTAVKMSGSNAEIELNGVKYTSETNSFAINGLTINSLATTNGNISITTTVDSQGIYDKVKEFLTEYNNVINEMTKLYNAESASDYEPLTDEEKEAMSDEQIEKWETKIKDSLLRRDTTLNSIMSVMVNAMAQTIEIGGQKLSLSTFGIQTLGFLNAPKNEHYAYHIYGDADDENTSGKEDELMKAIEANPDQVEEFMKKLSENLYTAIDNKMKSTELSSAYKVYNDKEMDSELKKYAETISKWEEKVADKEEYYYKQFSQMEVALSKLQNQTSAISGLLGM